MDERRKADIRRGSVTDLGTLPDETLRPSAAESLPTGVVGDAPPTSLSHTGGDVPVGTGMGDHSGIGGTSGAVTRTQVQTTQEGDLPGELGPDAGESSRVR